MENSSKDEHNRAERDQSDDDIVEQKSPREEVKDSFENEFRGEVEVGETATSDLHDLEPETEAFDSYFNSETRFVCIETYERGRCCEVNRVIWR